MAVPLFNWTDNGDGTWTWKIEGTNDADKVLATATDAARYLYPKLYQQYDEDQNPIPFDDLTLTQKKAIIGLETRRYFVECAGAYNATHAVDVARETAIEESGTKYDL